MTTRGTAATISLLLAVTACGGSSTSSSGMPPASSGSVRVRIAEGAPELEAIINGVPQNILPGYLQVDGQTVATQIDYGIFTQFITLSPGVHKLQALDDLGYKVGPFETASLATGEDYSLVIVGTYPNYRVLTFQEPATAKSGAQLSLYEASPAVPSADFGTFAASSYKGFKRVGSAKLGSIVTVALGAHVQDIGGYVGKGTHPFSCPSSRPQCATQTPKQIDSFDRRNALPFHNVSRLSLFLFDKSSTAGPVFGSLDR